MKTNMILVNSKFMKVCFSHETRHANCRQSCILGFVATKEVVFDCMHCMCFPLMDVGTSVGVDC
jgi:hypothetical protein